MQLRSLAFVPLFVACGGRSTPSEAEIYYAAALRPGVELATTEGERALLGQIALVPEGPFEAAGERFEVGPTYHAASGRSCRRVLTPLRERLACEASQSAPPTESQREPRGEPAWTFVPNPFEGSNGAEVPVLPAGYEGVMGSDDPSSDPSSGGGTPGEASSLGRTAAEGGTP